MIVELALLWTIQLAPLAAFALIWASPAGLKRFAPAVAIAGALTAVLAFLGLIVPHWVGDWTKHEYAVRWLNVGDASLPAGFLLDRLNMLMIGIVTTITLFVQIFSYYYMKDDPSRPRYFMFLSLFAFTMTGLVLSNNLLQTFIFWELVGLASYLLIGFWYQKPSASTAARKAFVINRLADLGFYLGIVLLFLNTGSLDFSGFTAEGLQTLSPGLATAVGLLVFMGVMGKSAQFPFHVWLPDAMEGPTPVSALIHSATMVAAGVFLLVRAYGLFAISDVTLQVVLVFGGITALLAAVLATAQNDIKKILAYSTVSQLGLMAMAVGVASPVAAMFHLTTHAYFKSLLFLTAGAFIHHFHTNDIWQMAREGAKKRFFDCFALSVGLFSLSGIFPFAGFFSKDLILDMLRDHNLPFYAVALLVSCLTSYYSFRLIFIFMMTPTPHLHAPHAHASSSHGHSERFGLAWVSHYFSLGTLTVLALGAGVLGSHFFHHKTLIWLGGEPPHTRFEILATALAVFLLGSGAAYWRFRDPEKAQARWEANRGALKQALENRFYIDHAYEFVVKKVALAFAALLNRFDRAFVNDVMVNDTSYGILNLGKLFSRLQSGLVQHYLLIALAATAGAAWWLITTGKGI